MMNDSEDTAAPVNVIFIKLPMFWLVDPDLWFAQFEAQLSHVALLLED